MDFTSNHGKSLNNNLFNNLIQVNKFRELRMKEMNQILNEPTISTLFVSRVKHILIDTGGDASTRCEALLYRFGYRIKKIRETETVFLIE